MCNGETMTEQADKQKTPVVRDFEDLVAWRKARALVKKVYRATKELPGEDLYGLARQMRRAAVSAVSNIAEGYGRGTRKEYVRFLLIARGSLYEVQTQTILAGDLEYMSDQTVQELRNDINESTRVLQGLINSLKPTAPKP